MADRAVVHQQRVEDFLARAEELARFAGGAFDFVSCCPPYKAVAYPALMAQLARSPLLHAGSWLVVEYPFEDRASLPDRLDGAGRSLAKLVDRRFGRTYVALYGPTAGGGGEAHGRGGGKSD